MGWYLIDRLIAGQLFCVVSLLMSPSDEEVSSLVLSTSSIILYSWTIDRLPKIAETSQPWWDIDVAKQCGFAATDSQVLQHPITLGTRSATTRTVRA